MYSLSGFVSGFGTVAVAALCASLASASAAAASAASAAAACSAAALIPSLAASCIVFSTTP